MDKSLAIAWTIGLGNGKLVHLPDATVDDIDIPAIIHSLSLQCRYLGHVKHHYSVAQHSEYVCQCVERELGGPCIAGFVALLHDFSEGMAHDIVRGIKVGLYEDGSRYHAIESHIQDLVYRKANLPDYEKYHDIVKKWDNRVLRTEISALIPNASQEWIDLVKDIEPADINIKYIPPNFAEQNLQIRYDTYYNCVAKGAIR